jgi:hypothetical protein
MKKLKKKSKKKHKKKKHPTPQQLLNMLESRVKESAKPFFMALDATSRLFREYSAEDIAESLFVSNIGLPNIASPVNHQFLTAIFATLKPEAFSDEDSIKTYGDFIAFLEKMYEIVPSFPSLEDFVPEPDWGEVKFHHAGKNYKIFYGNELSNVHEYLTLFQMLYEPYESDYMQHADRTPKYELQYCLRLQQEIIDGITAQPKRENLEISQGDLEIPPEEFWENARSFYSHFKPEQIVPEPFTRIFSINLGEYPKESLDFDVFGEKVFAGTLVQAFFIKHESRYFPILPRRYSSILFDRWSEVFQEHSEKVESSGERYVLRLGGQLHQYINKRLRTDNIFRVASAVTEKGMPHKIVFPTVFISKNRLVMLYIAQPALCSKKTEEELTKIAPGLNKALELASSQPTTISLHLDRQNVQFRSESGKDSLELEILILIPQVSTQIDFVPIPKSLPGRVMFLDSFLGIIDEIEYDETFADFLEYLDEIEGRTQSALSMLDKFASFKDSYGILIGGALEPDYIMLDPHWGRRMRYQSLAEFWKIYPEIDFFDHPRTWKVKQETETRTRLEARGYFGSAIYSRIGPIGVYLTAPFTEMEYQQGSLSNLLMECLEDSMSRRSPIFGEHAFFKHYDRFQVNFFPLSMVSNNERFKHLHHLCNIEKYWCSDIGMPGPDEYGIRVVFDDEAITKALTEAQDCSLEVDILIEVIKQLTKIVPDSQIDSIIESVEKTKSGKPRFKLFTLEKPASFPEFINPLEPKPAHFKKAKKRIAELVRQLNITEGNYELEDAKKILNKLRDAVVAEINAEVAKYNFADAITFLLARIDALNADYERHRHTVQYGLQHETDYQPEVKYAEHQTQFIKTHKNYRYLIEKFVQLEPRGKETFGKEQFQYLIALIDWLQVFYSASDYLHYGIMPVGMKLDRGYLVEVLYEEGIESNEKAFSEEMAQLELGLIGNPEDRVDSPRPVEKYLEELDKAATGDLGFSFQRMINVLQILSFWPASGQNVEESTSYSATYKEMEDACMRSIMGISREEIKPIIDFSTLKKDDVIRILGQDEPCQDLPVWEYRKRYARYNLRPLIQIGDKYYWGPYSVRRTGIIWSGAASTGMMPRDLQATSIVEVLKTEKKLIGDALTDKALEIMEKYTSHARKNLRLHNLKPKGSHPSELGDYDVLSFYPDKNIVFNIECKDIFPVHCLKDARRLRDKIFGRPGKEDGFLRQINRRQTYLSNHLSEIVTDLEWPVDLEKPPKIIPVFISRRSYWWTRFPPQRVEVVFLRIDLLSKFISDLPN